MKRLIIPITILSFNLFILFNGCSTESNENNPISSQETNCVTEVSQDITDATVWGENCDSIKVTKSIRVLADLTIKEGTVIQFAPNTNMVVDETGSVNAVGTETDSIIFEGTNKVKGWWSGIAFESQSQLNHFEYVKISDAGGVGYKTNRWVLTIAGNSTSPGTLRMIDVYIVHCTGIGLVIRNGGKLDFSYDNRFEDIDNAPIMIGFEDIGNNHIHGTTEFNNLQNRYILVTKGTLSKLASVTATAIPYRFGHDLDITSSGGLFIGPGSTIEFEQDVQLETNGGIISFQGTPEDPILLTGAEKTPDYWCGIAFESFDTNNLMKNVTLEYAGAKVRGNWEFGVFVSGNATTRGMLQMQDVHLKDIGGDGVYVREGGELTATNVTFENVTGMGIVDENDN